MRYDPAVCLDDAGGKGRSFRFSGRVGTLTACVPGEVLPLLAELEAVAAAGRHAVGFMAYEAASALCPHLPSLAPADGLPLAWFALFECRVELEPLRPEQEAPLSPLLESAIDQVRYTADVESIRGLIAAGECYQANYTFPLRGVVAGGHQALYRRFTAAQRAAYCACIDTGRHLLLSASPELFFRLSGNRIETRPMKGTIGRGRHPEEDASRARLLLDNPKERAENLMIVDLLRSDLGMVAEHGTVRVDSLFELESYPTVHQLTSTVSATVRAGTGLADIFRALFPCGSVTGAPKRRSMEILARLEGRPRGVYCGAIGMVSPGEAVFSVAIRTLVCDSLHGSVELGVGSGITWDSDPAAEFSECLSKARFTAVVAPRHGLIESLRREAGGYPLLERHLDRLEWSAGRVGIPFRRPAARQLLEGVACEPGGVYKVRLLVRVDGAMELSAEPVVPDSAPLTVALSISPVDPDDGSLYLKSADRSRYEQARSECPQADEALLVNTRGELTEGSYHNLVLKLDGRLVTPPLSSGLLPGVMRARLLAEGTIIEQTLTPDDLSRAGEIWLINAVRGWRRAVLWGVPCACS